MNSYNVEQVVCVGDTHSQQFVPLLLRNNLKNFVAVHVGDSGTGFLHTQDNKFAIDALTRYCERNNGYILVTRGNHDDDSYFKPGHWAQTYSERVKFIPDYTYIIINNKLFLFAGGATSIDRIYRKEGKSWWRDEVFKLPDNLDELEQCDVLITHSSGIDEFPINGLENIKEWFKDDKTLRAELIKEREDIQVLYNKVKPRIGHWYGHFHSSNTTYINLVRQQCLAIDEVVDITNLLT